MYFLYGNKKMLWADVINNDTLHDGMGVFLYAKRGWHSLRLYFQRMDLEKSLRKNDDSWIQDFQMLCTKQKFKNFQVSRLSQHGFSLISIQYHVHSRHSVHDGLLFIISAQMCTIQRHILKFQSLITFHLSQIFILSSIVFK